MQVFMFLFDANGKLLHANQKAVIHFCGDQITGKLHKACDCSCNVRFSCNLQNAVMLLWVCACSSDSSHSMLHDLLRLNQPVQEVL